MQAANNTLATTASAMALDNSIAARHTEHHQAIRFIDSANRPGRVLNKMELAVQQMRAGAATVPSTKREVERLFGRVHVVSCEK